MNWDSARGQIANALAAVQARDAAVRGASTTVEIALLEAIVDLDSDQADAVSTLGAGNPVVYSNDGNVRLGRLQQLARMESTFFGGDGQPGLLAELRALPDPNSEVS